jgi:hypothetical protein
MIQFLLLWFLQQSFLLREQLCFQPPTWRTKSLYLWPQEIGWPSFTHRQTIHYSSPSATRRATVEVASTTPCSMMKVNRRWLHGVIALKMEIFVTTVVNPQILQTFGVLFLAGLEFLCSSCSGQMGDLTSWSWEFFSGEETTWSWSW